MANRGRPAREPTPDQRKKVVDLLAAKAPLGDIAAMMGYSKPTFRKYFSAELISAKKSEEEKLPPLKITDVMREKVVRYIGCQMSPEQVADVLDITVEQLEANFAAELAKGQSKYRAKVLDMLDQEATKEGTIGAINRLEALTVIPAPEDPKVPGAHIIGKKAAQRASAGAAASAGGKFAPRPAPKLAVDNT